MALGPYLIQKMPQVVFIYGILLSVTSSVMIFISAKRCNESLPGPYSERLKRPMPQADFPRIKEYRRSYRLAFLLAGIIYTSGMALFPKLISASGLPLEKIGFLTVGANVGVFLSFLFMSRFNFWIGNPGKTLMIMLVIFSATVLSFFMPQTLLCSSLLLFFVASLMRFPIFSRSFMVSTHRTTTTVNREEYTNPWSV
jgi:hypothetical protein